jgi:hypothetical protein
MAVIGVTTVLAMTAAPLNNLAVDNSRVITALPFLRLDLVELVAVQPSAHIYPASPVAVLLNLHTTRSTRYYTGDLRYVVLSDQFLRARMLGRNRGVALDRTRSDPTEL